MKKTAFLFSLLFAAPVCAMEQGPTKNGIPIYCDSTSAYSTSINKFITQKVVHTNPIILNPQPTKDVTLNKILLAAYKLETISMIESLRGCLAAGLCVQSGGNWLAQSYATLHPEYYLSPLRNKILYTYLACKEAQKSAFNVSVHFGGAIVKGFYDDIKVAEKNNDNLNVIHPNTQNLSISSSKMRIDTLYIYDMDIASDLNIKHIEGHLKNGPVTIVIPEPTSTTDIAKITSPIFKLLQRLEAVEAIQTRNFGNQDNNQWLTLERNRLELEKKQLELKRQQRELENELLTVNNKQLELEKKSQELTTAESGQEGAGKNPGQGEVIVEGQEG